MHWKLDAALDEYKKGDVATKRNTVKVNVIFGEVFDVAADTRKALLLLVNKVGELSAENNRQLWVPKWLAHGFYVTSEETEFMCKCTDHYNHKTRCSIVCNYETPISVTPVLFAQDELAVCIDNSPGLSQ